MEQNSSHNKNFFIQQEDSFNYFAENKTSRRLNDYDYNILKDEAYKNMQNELLKLEYKISRLEQEIEFTNAQIQAAKDILDFEQAENLTLRKKTLIEEKEKSLKIYNDKSISAKISGGLTDFFSPIGKGKFLNIKKLLELVNQSILPHLPKNITYAFELKESLKKLENINRSVDELMTLQTPFGESGDKYIQLSKYITKANSIQSEINKLIK